MILLIVLLVLVMYVLTLFGKKTEMYQFDRSYTIRDQSAAFRTWWTPTVILSEDVSDFEDITSIRISGTMRDQGWGNKCSELYIMVDGVRVLTVGSHELRTISGNDYSWKTVDKTNTLSDIKNPGVLEVKLESYGSGCAMHVQNITINIVGSSPPPPAPPPEEVFTITPIEGTVRQPESRREEEPGIIDTPVATSELDQSLNVTVQADILFNLKSGAINAGAYDTTTPRIQLKFFDKDTGTQISFSPKERIAITDDDNKMTISWKLNTQFLKYRNKSFIVKVFLDDKEVGNESEVFLDESYFFNETLEESTNVITLSTPDPIDCKYSEWTIPPCGSADDFATAGTITKSRTIAQPARYGGAACTESLTGYHTCPLNCIYNDWTDSTPCNKSNGIKSQTRTVKRDSNSVSCLETSRDAPCDVNCEWGEWGPWSTTCGGCYSSQGCYGGGCPSCSSRTRPKTVTERNNGTCNTLDGYEEKSCAPPAPPACTYTEWVPGTCKNISEYEPTLASGVPAGCYTYDSRKGSVNDTRICSEPWGRFTPCACPAPPPPPPIVYTPSPSLCSQADYGDCGWGSYSHCYFDQIWGECVGDSSPTPSPPPPAPAPVVYVTPPPPPPPSSPPVTQVTYYRGGQ